jgi:TetR/AcrR family transcriptional repressor of nem operon
VESDDNHGLIKTKVCDALTVSQKSFVAILRAGIDNGEFNASLDPEAYAFKMFAAIEGATVMCRNMNNDQLMAGLIESLKNELRAYER